MKNLMKKIRVFVLYLLFKLFSYPRLFRPFNLPYLHAPVVRARREHVVFGGVPRHAVHVVRVRGGLDSDLPPCRFIRFRCVTLHPVQPYAVVPPPATKSPFRPQSSANVGRSWPFSNELWCASAKPGEPAVKEFRKER